MAGSSRSSSPTPQRTLEQNETQNIPEQQISDSTVMTEFTSTNTQALPASTSNLSAASKRTSGSFSIGPGPRSATLRPATLRKPRSRKPSFQGDQVTPDMRPVLHLFDIYSRKIYMEGYLCKQDIITNQGLTSSNDDWIEYYVELCGPILSFWKIMNNDSETPEVAQTPSILNLSNCLVDLILPQNNGSQRMHVFFINSIQGEKVYLQASDDTALNLWISAIHLSCFERSRIQEVYTATLIKRPGLKDFGNGTVLAKGKLEGYLQVQFSGNVEPKKYWVVVADHRVEDKKKKNLSFTRGQALFYENKKNKKPFMTLANVLQTYAIYPENPVLIDKTVTFCVEGSLFPTKPTENKPGDFVILTTDSLNEMTKWLFGFFDSFKLYGRPKELIYDFKNPVSPFFAVPTGRSNTKLFLDLYEVEHVEMRESPADVKAAFSEILRQSYNLQQQLPDNSQQQPSNANQKFNKMPGKLSVQSPPQIVTDGLSENYVRQRVLSNESASVPSSNSPSMLRPANQSSRPNSMVSLTGGSQKGSIPTTPVSPHSPLATNINRSDSHNPIITSSQETKSNKRRGKKAKQLASSDEDESEDQQGEDNESEYSDDEENDDPTLLKNTQENAKIVVETETKLAKDKADESISFGNSFEPFGDSDFVSEIMTAVAERKDESIQEDDSTKKSKPKRSVSFKNQPAKQKGRNKQRLAPLPSDSEDSDNSDEESLMTKSDEDSSEDSSLNKMVKSNQIIKKPGKGNKKKTRIVPQPSDSSDDNDESNDDDKKKMGAQTQQRTYRQSPPYGQYGPGSKQPRSGTYNIDKNYSQIQQGNFENDVEENVILRRNPIHSHNVPPGGNVADEQFRGRSKGKKPIRKGFGDITQEADSEQEDNNTKGTAKSNKKELSSQQDDYQFELGPDIDISALNFDTTSEPANKIPSDDDNDEVLNRTTKVFKPTKQKDKQKNITRPSDSSSDGDETKSLTSEEEPLAALVEEGGGLNPNFGRLNFNTPPRSVSPNYPPRSVSPNYPPNQRWGPLIPGSDYMDNMSYLPVDNRRSVMMPPNIHYDDDYMNAGGRPRSVMNPGQMMAGRRRVSGGQLDYTRESLYLDDGYYDDRNNVPSHFRPLSLIDTIPQSQLSAREQEMLARETGTPLINLQERQKDPQTGLVGAITARENQRRAMGSGGLLARQAELERERAFERERERRLLEQRQQAINRQSHFGPPVGDPRSSRFLGSQQYLDPMSGHRGSYYENYGPYIQTEDDYDEDDDVPLAVGNSIPSTIPPAQTRQPRAARNRRRDTE